MRLLPQQVLLFGQHYFTYMEVYVSFVITFDELRLIFVAQKSCSIYKSK